MNIGIIGAGMIGETLARRLAQLGHQIAVTRNGQRFLLSAIVETDAKAALSVVQNWTEGIKQ